MLLFFSFIIFILSQIIFSRNAQRLHLIDKPGTRKKHIGMIPTVGGISIFFSLLFYYIFGNLNEYFKLIFFTSSIIFISGLLDDIFKLSVFTRIVLQLIACFMLIFYNFKIVSLGEYGALGTINLGLLSIPFSIIAIMLLTNAINWIDGIDGLASSIYLQSFIAINIVMLIDGNVFELNTIYTLLFVN